MPKIVLAVGFLQVNWVFSLPYSDKVPFWTPLFTVIIEVTFEYVA